MVLVNLMQASVWNEETLSVNMRKVASGEQCIYEQYDINALCKRGNYTGLEGFTRDLKSKYMSTMGYAHLKYSNQLNK